MPEKPQEPRKTIQLGIILLLVLGAVGIYTQILQWIFYQCHPPFFDSSSYYDRVYDVVSIRRQEGLLAALQNAALKDSTFCLPYLLAIPASFVTGPTRAIGNWIEVFYLSIFVFSLAAYLRRVRSLSTPEILCCILPFLSMHGFYRFSSGLSDLRVDLPLAFLYCSTACWWLTGRFSGSWGCFVFAGFCAGLACLTRGIAPVYLVCGFIPLVLFEMLRMADRTLLLLQATLVIGLAILISAWFYAIHFEFIYYYYAVWNTDANASLPLMDSLGHLVATAKSIGAFFAIHAILVLYFTRSKSQTTDIHLGAPVSGQKQDRQRDAASFLWLGLAPLIMLIAKRAAINPFVSLPAALALSTAVILMLVPRILLLRARSPGRLVFCLIVLIGLAWGMGWHQHTKHSIEPWLAHQKLLQLIQKDARENHRNHVVYSVNLITHVNCSSLENMFQFECDSTFVDYKTVKIEGVKYTVEDRLMNPSQANWDRLEGGSTEEKIRNLEALASARVDYLVTFSKESVGPVQQVYPQDISTRFAAEIVSVFENSGSWMPISEPLEIGRGVSLRLMRNKKTGHRQTATD